MNLEAKGKLMLEALALQGEIKSKEDALSKLNNKVNSFDRLLIKAKADKDEQLNQRDATVKKVESKQASVKSAEATVKEKQAVLSGLKKELYVAQQELAKYDDAFLSSFDAEIDKVVKDKNAAMSENVKASKALADSKAELEKRLKELSNLGVKLDLSEPAKAANITYL